MRIFKVKKAHILLSTYGGVYAITKINLTIEVGVYLVLPHLLFFVITKVVPHGIAQEHVNSLTFFNKKFFKVS